MVWVRKSDGTRVQVKSEDVWGLPPTAKQITAKAEAGLQAELDAMTDRASDRDKALAFLMGDIWRSINLDLTQQEAWAAVRRRLETHLRNIKGL